ncbi:phosphodiesterase, partial [Mycobacterium sp. ITM-2017-0098]
TLNPDIETTSIANWNVISAIAASGAGVDNLFNVPEQQDDPRWLKADDLVGDVTEVAIANAEADVANLLFSYFVGIDENGHLYGGDSPEYAEAILNFDRNLGEIMAAVDAWEGANGEQWTIMMVTDHGHQPGKGFGHGFQSPDETATFVIANNPDMFTPGGVNLQYSIIDVTPTVMTLFGFEPAEDSDGVSLTDLDDSTVTPDNDTTALRQALNDAIAMNDYPDIATNIALSVRTIAATIPYYVDNITNGIVAALQGLAGQDIFLISPLAALAVIPVDIIGDIAYIATNIVAQIVARLTGVTGASIFPLERPATPTFPETPEESSTLDLLAVVCSDGRVSGAVFTCGTPGIAA